MIGQMIVLNRRLGTPYRPGPKAYDFRGWLAVSLPILLVESFYLLLSYTDVLVLQQFRPSDEVGVYFAVVKTLALVSFIHYAMSATTAHRFTEYHAPATRSGSRPMSRTRSNGRSGRRSPRRCVLLALGKPLLWLFGPQFVSGYDIMFVAAIGLVVRSAIGPVERLLNMLGHQHVCAPAYALAFGMNVVLCFALVPRYGGHGAAAATSISLVFETVLLFWIVRRKLGLHVLAFGKRRAHRRPHSSPRMRGPIRVSPLLRPDGREKTCDARHYDRQGYRSLRRAGLLEAMLATTPPSSRRRSTGWRR